MNLYSRLIRVLLILPTFSSPFGLQAVEGWFVNFA